VRSIGLLYSKPKTCLTFSHQFNILCLCKLERVVTENKLHNKLFSSGQQVPSYDIVDSVVSAFGYLSTDLIIYVACYLSIGLALQHCQMKKEAISAFRWDGPQFL
jgi:hypothetical protein